MSAPTRNFIISFFQALEQLHVLWLLLAEKLLQHVLDLLLDGLVHVAIDVGVDAALQEEKPDNYGDHPLGYLGLDIHPHGQDC